MRRELLMICASVVLSVALGLGLIRWLAPELLGVPPDLRLVETDEKVPPFYENVFRPRDLESADYLIADPWLTRAKPLYPDMGVLGPNDLLGFRNRAIPVAADIIAIGDSQTYGNNALLAENWPNRLANGLGTPRPVVYAMAVGAWSALEYLYAVEKAPAFRPRVIVVAFYAGNDPLGAFISAYGNPRWSEFRPDQTLASGDAPVVSFPAPPEQQWRATLPGGSEITFTPELRRASVMAHPAVDAGWQIMETAAGRIADFCRQAGVRLVFTIIPTKELVYAPMLAEAGVDAPPAYRQLVAEESARLASFAQVLRGFGHGDYVDVLAPLQAAARGLPAPYPENADGHPLAPGYAVIADSIAKVIDPAWFRPPPGLYGVSLDGAPMALIRLVDDRGWWALPSVELAVQNGWARTDPISGESSLTIYPDDGRITATWPFRGVVDGVDPQRFGPRAP